MIMHDTEIHNIYPVDPADPRFIFAKKHKQMIFRLNKRV